jgi:hypothetical protein
MLAKCANPICEAHFLYLKQGRVYNVPVYSPEAQSLVSPLRVEHFWLCATCCETLTLVLRNGNVEVHARFALLTDGGDDSKSRQIILAPHQSTAA